MQLYDRYYEAITGLIGEIREAERENIARAARVCADTLQNKGLIHVYDTGHLVNRELVNRVGGLAAFTPLTFDFGVQNPNRYRDEHKEPPIIPPTTTDTQLVSVVISRSNFRPGDVLIVGTVSGKTAVPIELAIQAKQLGLTVISVTAIKYSSQLKSDHQSGKRLFEVTDLVIDNHAEYGDAMLEVEGIDRKIIPASGVGAVIALWSLVAAISDEMLQRGLAPTFFKSINLPDGPAVYQATMADYIEKGY